MSAVRPQPPVTRLKSLLQSTLLAVAGFLLGLWLAFPAVSVSRYLLAEISRQGIAIAPSGLKRSWPLGIEATSAAISVPGLQGHTLRLDRIALTPALLPAPAVRLTAGFWQGQLEAVADRHRNIRLDLQSARIPAELSAGLPLTVAGRIASLTFSGRLPLAGANQSRAELILEGLTLQGLTSLGAGQDSLKLGKLHANVEGTGNRLKLTRLGVDGALRVAGSGTIWLGQTPATTRINLQLTLTPTPALDPGIRDLLALLGKGAADGSISLRLGGTLAAPHAR